MRRIAEVVAGVLAGILSTIILAFTHRISFDLGEIQIPAGVILGGVFSLALSLVLALYYVRKLPLVIMAGIFALLIYTFSGNSAGGGILMPAQIAGEFQWQGPAIQFLGVLVPLIVVAVVWGLQIKNLNRQSQQKLGETNDLHHRATLR